MNRIVLYFYGLQAIPGSGFRVLCSGFVIAELEAFFGEEI